MEPPTMDCAIQLLGPPAAELDSSPCCGVDDTYVLNSSQLYQINIHTQEFVQRTKKIATEVAI